MARKQIVERRAIDPTLTFQERRRDRYLRRGEKRAREDALDAVLGALALVAPFALWAAICWAQSLAYGLGLLGQGFAQLGGAVARQSIEGHAKAQLCCDMQRKGNASSKAAAMRGVRRKGNVKSASQSDGTAMPSEAMEQQCTDPLGIGKAL